MAKAVKPMTDYYERICEFLKTIHDEECESVARVAPLLAEHIKRDKLIYIWGPGGHSNIAAMEGFFRAGGLMHVSAILDGGTMLSNGAMRSMGIERTPGYGRVVIGDNGIGQGDILIIANAYGINAACIDAALEAKERGATTIAISSRIHAENTAPGHPARHPCKKNLHDVVDYHIDSKVEVGDAVIGFPGVRQKMGPMSTFANAYLVNSLMMETVSLLAEEGVEPPIWLSGNAPGGDEWSAPLLKKFKGRVRWL